MSEQTARSKSASATSWLSTLARLLFLLILVGVSAAGYIYLWPEVEAFQAKQADVEESLTSLARADEALANDLTALIESRLKKSEDATVVALQSAVTRLSAELDSIRDIEQRAAEKLNEANRLLYRMSKTDQSTWRRAEATFNIRLARQRLQFAHDVDGALTLLAQADVLLQADSNEAVSTIRSAIAFDLAQLKTVQKLDVVGLMGRLSALERQIQTLDLTTFDPSTATKVGISNHSEATKRPANVKVSQTLWEQALKTLSSYFVITELESPEQKPKSAHWADLAKLSIKLNVEQARVALLARDSESFVGALSRTADVLEEIPSSSDALALDSLLGELAELSSTSLDLALPALESLKVINAMSQRSPTPQQRIQGVAEERAGIPAEARIIE